MTPGHVLSKSKCPEFWQLSPSFFLSSQFTDFWSTFTFFFLILPILQVASNKVSTKVKAISFAENGSYFVTAGNRQVTLCYGFVCLCASFNHIFNRIYPISWIGMWSSGTWSTQEVPNTRSQYLWWAGMTLLIIVNIILYDNYYGHYYLYFSRHRPHQDYYFAALPGRPFLASRGTTISVMWLAAGERWWVHFNSDTNISTVWQYLAKYILCKDTNICQHMVQLLQVKGL